MMGFLQWLFLAVLIFCVVFILTLHFRERHRIKTGYYERTRYWDKDDLP